MKEEYTPRHTLSPEDIYGTIDCCECPHFLQLDICGYEVATNPHIEI